MMRYAVFAGANRPSFETKTDDTISVKAYEQLADRFLRLAIRVDYTEFQPDALTIKGSTSIDGQPYRVQMHLSARSPGNDTIRFYDT